MSEREINMKLAIDLSKKSLESDDVPVGAVIVDATGKVIGCGYNARNKDKISFYHAEIMAIKEACEYKKDWRLSDCTIYVTLEPCDMCYNVIRESRIKKIVFGALNKNVVNRQYYCECEKNIYSKEISQIILDFFNKIR